MDNTLLEEIMKILIIILTLIIIAFMFENFQLHFKVAYYEKVLSGTDIGKVKDMPFYLLWVN